jgi:hypothetical protein
MKTEAAESSSVAQLCNRASGTNIQDCKIRRTHSKINS